MPACARKRSNRRPGVDKATADLTLAKSNLRRTSDWPPGGYASQQNLDNAQAAVAAAERKSPGADAIPQLPRPSTARRPRIAPLPTRSGGGRSLAGGLERRFEKLRLGRPSMASWKRSSAELGEATVPGRTVLTIAATAEPWFSFNVREDALRGMDIGTPWR